MPLPIFFFRSLICILGAASFLAAADSKQASFSEDFSKLENWQSYTSGPGGLAVSTDSAGNLKLATENVSESGQARTIRIVTKAAYPDLNFVRENETVGIVLDNLVIRSRGATSSFQFGLTPDPANGHIYTRANSIYFAQNGSLNASLVLRDGGDSTTLWTTTDSGRLSHHYRMIRLTLTRTTWALTLYDGSGNELVNESGAFTSPANRGWRANLHAHFTLNQSSNNQANTTLLMKGIFPFVTTPPFPANPL